MQIPLPLPRLIANHLVNNHQCRRLEKDQCSLRRSQLPTESARGITGRDVVFIRTRKLSNFPGKRFSPQAAGTQFLPQATIKGDRVMSPGLLVPVSPVRRVVIIVIAAIHGQDLPMGINQKAVLIGMRMIQRTVRTALEIHRNPLSSCHGTVHGSPADGSEQLAAWLPGRPGRSCLRNTRTKQYVESR